MIFNSFQFLWLFPLIFIGYAFLPCLFTKSKARRSQIGNYLLILVSYALYMQWNAAYALILLGVTAVTYGFARIIEAREAYGRKYIYIYIITAGASLALLPLLLFKYYNFITQSIASVLPACSLPGLNWAIPIGISFFSFQAVGYLWDVYYKRIPAEHNWWDYMLFVCFFPQIMSGPISKASSLLPQIKSERPFDYNKAVQGLKWLLWGLFLKTVMADRVGLWVDSVLPNYMYQTGTTCAMAAIGYSFQIYGDFAGYSLMAIGVGRLLGFDLINNFHRPYLADSVTEFWKRWHISLTKWLTDYVYIPLGGSRCSKFRTYLNIMITFLVSGIWHGANWTFIVWGVMHGLFQIVEKALGLQKTTDLNGIVRAFRIIFTFVLVTLAWVFFRMPTLEGGWGVVSKMFTFGPFVNSMVKADTLFTFTALFVVIVKEIVEEYHPTFTLINHRSIWVRWTTYIVLVLGILMCGVLDAGQFIYVSF